MLRRGAVVIYASTVYPGATESICIPVLQRHTGMQWKRDFFVAYSPERVNPGDREHTIARIVKVVAGDTPATLDKVAALYESIVPAGVYRAGSIAVAEAAKVIENVQRDLNIALMNEFALIFHRLGLDTQEVLQAAATKWNFMPFSPGLVGGHCIGVDPYYLTHRAQATGHVPQVILAGRRINDDMGRYVAAQTIEHLAAAGCEPGGATVNVLGLTFKEECRDVRNSKVADVLAVLRERGITVHVHDPLADPAEAQRAHGVRLCTWNALPRADAIVVAVAHRAYRNLAVADLAAILRPGGSVIDVKCVLDADAVRAAGYRLWRL